MRIYSAVRSTPDENALRNTLLGFLLEERSNPGANDDVGVCLGDCLLDRLRGELEIFHEPLVARGILQHELFCCDDHGDGVLETKREWC